MTMAIPLLGLLLVAASARLARFPTLLGQSANLLLLLVAMVACFVGALVVARRVGRDVAPGRPGPIVLSWPFLLAVGLLMRIPLLLAPPQLSDDIYRYLWDGRVAVSGVNPYRHAPTDTALASLRDADWSRINNPTLPTIYPPVAQRLFEMAARLAPGVTGSKLLLILFDLAVALILASRVARQPADRWRCLVWWWHPLAAIEWSGSGHVDVAGIALLLAAFTLATAKGGGAGRWFTIGGLAAGATMVKFLALLALPFLPLPRRAIGWVAMGFALMLLVGYLPYMAPDTDVLGSLGTYAARWRANDFFFGLLVRPGTALDQPARLTEAKLYAALLCGAIAIVVLLVRAGPAAAITTVTGSALLLSPTIHPWYLAWLLPFVATDFSVSWIYATLASLLSYQAVPAWLEGRPSGGSVGSKLLLAMPFLFLAAWESRHWLLNRDRKRSSGS